MTPQEKAEELIKKMQLNDDWGEIPKGQAAEHAIVLVDEIMQLDIQLPFGQEENYIKTFYVAVKKELESF